MFCNGGNQKQGGNYDAMISYSDKDLPIVLKYVVPNFETHANLRLFVRHRDDPQAGMTINAIQNSIVNIGIAVCLVTKNYLKSEMQCYELAMIRKRMKSHINNQGNLLNNQQNFHCRIIGFRNVTIPNEISNLDNNRVNCPVEDGNDDSFWRALGNAL